MMKFTKTFVAVAIAGIAATPMVASAATTLSGVVQIKMQGSDADGDAGDLNAAAGDVNINLNSESELDSGLTGYGNIRLDVDQVSNQKSEQLGTADSVYVGIKGGFGDIRVGEIPLAVEVGQVANDIYDVGGEINGGLSYTGSFGPVGLTANFSPEPNSDALGLGASFGIGGFTVGVGGETRGDDTNIAAGVSFALGGASVAAHFWSKDADADTAEDSESIAVKVGYGFGGVSAAVTFATLMGETDGNDTSEETAIRLDLGYGLGGGTEISTRITATTDDLDSNNDLTEYRVQLSKSF